MKIMILYLPTNFASLKNWPHQSEDTLIKFSISVSLMLRKGIETKNRKKKNGVIQLSVIPMPGFFSPLVQKRFPRSS